MWRTKGQQSVTGCEASQKLSKSIGRPTDFNLSGLAETDEPSNMIVIEKGMGELSFSKDLPVNSAKHPWGKN